MYILLKRFAVYSNSLPTTNQFQITLTERMVNVSEKEAGIYLESMKDIDFLNSTDEADDQLKERIYATMFCILYLLSPNDEMHQEYKPDNLLRATNQLTDLRQYVFNTNGKCNKNATALTDLVYLPYMMTPASFNYLSSHIDTFNRDHNNTYNALILSLFETPLTVKSAEIIPETLTQLLNERSNKLLEDMKGLMSFFYEHSDSTKLSILKINEKPPHSIKKIKHLFRAAHLPNCKYYTIARDYFSNKQSNQQGFIASERIWVPARPSVRYSNPVGPLYQHLLNRPKRFAQ